MAIHRLSWPSHFQVPFVEESIETLRLLPKMRNRDAPLTACGQFHPHVQAEQPERIPDNLTPQRPGER